MNTITISTLIQKVFMSGVTLLSNSKDALPKNRYIIIPGKSGNIRWILPSNPKLGIAGLQFWHPYDFMSRFKWEIILEAYRLRRLTCLPGAYEIGVTADHVITWEHLGIKGDVCPVIYVGEPYARCKAIVFLVQSNGESCHYLAKVPLGSVASHKILHEASILKALESRNLTIASHCTFEDQTQGVAGQEVLPVRNTSRKFTENHTNWLINLHQGYQKTSLALHIEYLWKRLQALPIEKYYMYRISPTLKILSDPKALPSVWSHGDFAPWNFKKVCHNNSLVAVDWEEGRQDMLPLYDAIHFFYAQCPPRNLGRMINNIQDNPFIQQYMKHFNLESSLIWPMCQFFFLDYWCRRLEENDQLLATSIFNQIESLLGCP